MKIYVDADACPVQDTIISIAEREDIQVVLIRSYSHYAHAKLPAHVKTIHVDKGADVADFRIIQLAKKGDIIVTQDYGLASLCLAKGCIVIHHTGFAYTKHNIDQLLQSRYLGAKARQSGEKTKGPKAFTKENEDNFSTLLSQTIEHTQKK